MLDFFPVAPVCLISSRETRASWASRKWIWIKIYAISPTEVCGSLGLAVRSVETPIKHLHKNAPTSCSSSSDQTQTGRKETGRGFEIKWWFLLGHHFQSIFLVSHRVQVCSHRFTVKGLRVIGVNCISESVNCISERVNCISEICSARMLCFWKYNLG